jgi:hypothetical protein
MFTDDDVRVDAGWLETLLDAAARYPEGVAFGGPIEPDFPFPPDPDLVAAFPALAKGFCGLDYQRPEGALPADLGVWGANMAYRFDAVSRFQFDPSLGVSPTSQRGGEEEAFQELVRAAGGTIVWVPTMTVRHYVDPSRMTIKYLIAFQIGKGEQHVYRDRPTLTGRSAWGAPIWLLRRMVSAYGRYLVSRFTSTRARALEDLKAYCHYRGMVRACREFAATGRPYNRQGVVQ